MEGTARIPFRRITTNYTVLAGHFDSKVTKNIYDIYRHYDINISYTKNLQVSQKSFRSR